MRRGRRRTLLAAVALVAILASGCEVDIDVGVRAEPDGSGEVAVTVELDAEAADRVPDLASQLRLGDLGDAGWIIDGPSPVAGGAWRVVATRDFASPDEAGQVLAAVGGASGPFQGFELTRRTSFLSTDFAFAGAVDLTSGLDAFADDELRARLAGSGFSLETAELEQALGAPAADTFRFEVRAALPGRIEAEGEGVFDDGAVIWQAPLGERLVLAATSESRHVQRLVWLVVSVLAALGLVVTIIAGRRRHR